MEAKRLAGERAAEFVQDGMIVGLGSGSTVHYTLQRLGERVREGLKIRGVPTSHQTRHLARQFSIPLIDFTDAAPVEGVKVIDLAIDGADEVSPQLDPGQPFPLRHQERQQSFGPFEYVAFVELTDHRSGGTSPWAFPAVS